MNEPIRVLILVTIMNRGGAEAMIMNYYRNIDRTKVQFDFLVHRDEKGAYEDEITDLGGKIYRAMPIYPQNFVKYKKFLKNFFAEHKEFKIVHSHMSELGYFAFKEAKKQNVPYRICHAHNFPTKFDLKMLMRDYFKFKMRNHITHRFMCSKESGEWLFGKKYINNCIQVNNAIDCEKFKYDRSLANDYKKRLNLENNFVVGHIGRFNYQKNHKFLIEVFNEIYHKNKNARLILIGDGELRTDIENQIKKLNLSDVVHILGVRADVANLMQAIDVLIFPSFFEGLPVVLVEAQAGGLKCFVSSSITKEVAFSDLICYFDLEVGSEIWANEVLKNINYQKVDRTDSVISNGYEIKNAVEWLENFYLEVK